MQYFYVFLYKSKGYHVDQKLDVIEINRGHFWIQRSADSQIKCQSANTVFPMEIIIAWFDSGFINIPKNQTPIYDF